ncbi:MAG: ABC transporter substrate-binding protein [Deltaproteobacteria bacterium]|nr:ABC transporter substrate-binding protein [Deltaproteobacteria bacterium]
MAKILLHCPLNISRAIVQMMEEFCGKLHEKNGIDIQVETQPHRADEKSLLKTYVENDDLPDLIVGHVDDFADFTHEYIAERFQSLPGRFPVRRELSDKGFTDTRGYFHPFGIIPFAVFYNRNMLGENEIPGSWEELLDPQWAGKVLIPDEFRIVSVVTKAFIKADFPDKFCNFKTNFIHRGNPMEVVTAVDEGNFPLGITNIAFARISREKNTRIIWPKEGLFCMPQVMVWGKKAPESLFEVGDFLMSKKVQEFLSMQSFVPVSDKVPMPSLLTENRCPLRWDGWESFMKAVKGRH